MYRVLLTHANGICGNEKNQNVLSGTENLSASVEPTINLFSQDTCGSNKDKVIEEESSKDSSGNLKMCEDKTCPEANSKEVGMNEEGPQTPQQQQQQQTNTTVEMNGHSHATVTEEGELSPLSTDSGHVSAASTPEAVTPHEERSTSNLQNGTEEVVTYANETSYTVKIVPPGTESFELQVSSGELVQEIHQVLLDREDTCHRSCFSLQLDCQTLDNFTELRNVEGIKDEAVLRVVEEPYTVREARIHLRHVRDLLRSLDPADAYNGSECASLSFLNTVTAGGNDRKRANEDRSRECAPPDYILPGSKERPLTPLQPVNKENNNIQCLKQLSLSGWNPPPGTRKLHGDLLYLYAVTLEDKPYHITCCTRGFYVNQSTGDEFNPKPANQKFIYHSLVELFGHLSPSFKRNFALVQKKRCSRHIFERLPTPYQVHTWTAPNFENVWDSIRAEDGTQSHKLGFEDHIPGQIRDWNEELQTTRELPRKTLPERLIRERAIFKIHSDFVAAAVRGAVAVVDGNVMAINPGDEAKMQMFIWNNIFFSLGFDVKDHYKDFGGDAAAFVAPTNDLQGVKAYFNLDQEKLYTLGTVIVDYRGNRVTAQSIIPGILEREQEQSVVYGSIDFGKTVITSDKYKELLEKPAQQLKIYPHKVKSQNGSVVTLYSSAETKGIVGNEGRHYILDLLRTFPPDVNFLPEAEVTEVCRNNGFPRQFPHKLACLRQELIDAFTEAKYVMFIKIAAYHLQKLRLQQLVDGEGAANLEKEGGKDEKVEASSDGLKTPEATAAAAAAPASGPLCNGDESSSHHDNDACNSHVFGNSSRPSSLLLKSEGVEGHVAAGVNEMSGRMNGESIAEEVKRKIAASRESSPNSRDLPAEEEAKRIMENITAPKSDANGPITGESMEAATKEIIKNAARAVGSLSDTEFDVRFNPDCYCTTVIPAEEDEVDIERQRRLVRDAAHFLLVSQIPNFVRDCLDHSLTPVDGYGLSEAMHTRGINMRYLGKISQYIADIPQLNYLKVICMCELLCRSAKHVIRPYLQGVDQSCLAGAASHFLNCLVGSCPNPQAPINNEDLVVKRRAGKKKRGHSTSSVQDSAEWSHLTPKTLWQQCKEEAQTYYGFEIDSANIDAFVETYGIQRVSILRRACLVCGIQILLRDYCFDNKTRPPFTDEDVINVFPIVKHISPRASDAFNFYQTGQAKIQQGQLRAGYELVSEALNLLNNVYGAMHPEIAQCLRLLARLAYILGDHQEALGQQHKAVLMSERCCGIDHPQTILEYMHLALYCFANLQVATALKLLYRARYLLLVAHGEYHPQMALIDSNIGLILHAVQEYDTSLKFLEHALELHTLYYGRSSLKTALTFHLIGRAHACRGDFRTALQFEKETFTIYKNSFGEEHEKTKESSDTLRMLTQQAVSFQKKMNEIARNANPSTASISQLLPLQQPSLQSVLEMLNIVNGIVFIQISPKEVEALRAELEKGGVGSGGGGEDSSARNSGPKIIPIEDDVEMAVSGTD